MKTKHDRIIEENFGMPLDYDDKIGTKIGDEYAGEPAVGVRDMREAGVCSECGTMPVDGECECGCMVEDKMCSGCGMSMHDCMCDVEEDTCSVCSMMPVNNSCGCGLLESEKTCAECGMKEGICECGINEAKKKKDPTKKTAQKILRGTKTFKDKMKKVSGWAKDPAAGAAWMMHKATGKWPSEK
jgi:hypothetical protein